MSGLGVGAGMWAVVLAKAAANLVENPSLEYGTTGWGALGGGATIGSVSSRQAFGAWSLETRYTTTSEGCFYNAGTPAAGSYTLSGYMAGTSGHTLRLLATEATASGILGSIAVTPADTGWQYVSCSFAMPSGTGLQVIARHTSPAAAGSFWMDGLQLESGTFVTSYFDGDSGGTWTGAPHASTSTRSGQDRSGGTIIALADLGWNVDQMPGVGVPPIEISSQSYAILPGAQFQRQRPGVRQLTLTARPVVGTSLADFHITRRTIWDALKPDAVSPTQPVRFMYVGGQGTVQIDAYYDHGFELGNMDGPIAEDMAVSFISTDPFWYAPTQSGTTLVPLVQLGSVNYLAKRSPLGAWGTLGASNGTTVLNPPAGILDVQSLAINPGGTVYLGGNFGTLAGTTAPHIGMYYPSSNTFGSLVGGTVQAAGGPVHTLALNPGGTVYLGGLFLNAAGTTCNSVAQWTGAGFGTLTNGTVAANSLVWSLVYSPTGTLFLGGLISSFAGTTNSANAAFWTSGGGFGTLGGTVNGQVFDQAIGGDLSLYLGGQFQTVNGTQGTSVARWKDGVLGTISSSNGLMFALALGPDGKIYEGGSFSVIGGQSVSRAAVWNGVGHTGLGYGLSGVFGVQDIVVNQQDGEALYVGRFNAIGSLDPNGTAQLARWSGGAWRWPDIRIKSSGYAYSAVYGPDRTLFLAGEFNGTAQAAAIGTIVNPGRAEAYPTLRLRNTSTGTAQVWSITNITTGDEIDFNLQVLSNEVATLDLTPGDRSFRSNFRQNLLNTITPGSSLATWRLLPGTNYVSFFSDNSSLEVSLFWQNRGWSADSGTLY